MKDKIKEALKQSGGWGRSYINWKKFGELIKPIKQKDI